MKTFVEYFNIILTGNKQLSREAARQVRKLLYSSQGGRDRYKDIQNIINNAPGEYDKIFEEWRRENFVIAVSVLYFLHNRESPPDFLFPWLFQLLQHPNGVIRYASVRMLSHEIGPLTVHIRCPNGTSHYSRVLSSQQSDRILFEMFVNLMRLIEYLWQPAYKKYKYISSLPSSSYKSVSMVLGRLEEYCGKEYVTRLVRHLEEYIKSDPLASS